MTPRLAIVDPYSSGALLAPAFAARGRQCVAVLSSEIPALFRSSFRAKDFRAVVHPHADVVATAARLRELDVERVLAGSEPGVELADELNGCLGVAGNGPALRSARRDKYLMTEAVGSSGLRTAAQFCSPRLEDLRRWAREHDAWPLVAKPPRSVASDSVAVCRTEVELERAYEAIAGRTNVLGLVNETVLVQELLEGPEYVVDTVSHAGRHRVAAFWRYHRPISGAGESGVFYEAIELLPYEGERQEALLAYAVRVLDTLEIRYGPAHCELIWTAGRGPVLVEIGARLSAGSNATLSRLCGGPCALDLTVEACLEPDSFLASLRRPRLTSTAANCFLVRPDEQRVRARPELEEIHRLRSFHRMSIARREGRRRIVGLVTLIHPTRRGLHRDIRRLRRLERTRLYEPAAAARPAS